MKKTRLFSEFIKEADSINQDENIIEANPDGTISDDEEEKMEIAKKEIYDAAFALAQQLKEEAYYIGGNFRGPGYERDLVAQVMDAFKKSKIRLK